MRPPRELSRLYTDQLIVLGASTGAVGGFGGSCDVRSVWTVCADYDDGSISVGDSDWLKG
jgi:hypothetical protein